MEDNRIIELYFARSERAIRETDKKYGQYCSSISQNILPDKRDVQECVNDTYLQVWNSVPPTRPFNLAAYLAKIVRNLSINRLKAERTQKRSNGQFDACYDELSQILPATAADIADALHLRQCITQWLSDLPQQHRMAFVGRYWYFEPVKNLSARLGFSESKMKMLLLRLRHSLKEYLEKEKAFL